MSAKVYCSNCIFFSICEGQSDPFGWPTHQIEKCLSPENFTGNYLNEQATPISTPRIINKYNNCEWYTPENGDDSSSSSSGCPCSSSTSLI